MSLLNFSKANCRNCYKCLRTCPVKAIKIKNEQAEIVEERCIGCGQCLIVCPQDARNIKSDLEEVKTAINEGRRVIATVAPSFAGAFNTKEPEQLVAALKSIGFSRVEETAIGAEIVADQYEKILNEGKYDNLITTCCPSANYLVDRYFPTLTKYLMPVMSPMLAHAKLLKHENGEDSFVVFIGPCVAKKIESLSFQHKGLVDAVITFEELTKWIEEEGINIQNLVSSPFDKTSYNRGCSFPLGGGVISSFGKSERSKDYEWLKVDGIEECIGIFNSLEDGNMKGVCVEVNICRGGCINGPVMPKGEKDFFKKQRKIKEYVMKKKKSPSEDVMIESSNIDFSKKFIARPITKNMASEAAITEILRSMGKFEKSDELNCCGCGYNTCREKAQAVYEGMAEMNMCLPFMRSKAESLTNVIFENTPNIIMVIDEKLRVKEFNPTAEKIFGVKAERVKNQLVSTIIEDDLFRIVQASKESLIAHKIAYKKYGVVLLQSILYIEKQDVILAIMTDITKEELQREELKTVREKTLDAAQKVIEKQMRVAQEIASLLGETTAETKVTLTKLKEIAIIETGDQE